MFTSFFFFRNSEINLAVKVQRVYMLNIYLFIFFTCWELFTTLFIVRPNVLQQFLFALQCHIEVLFFGFKIQALSESTRRLFAFSSDFTSNNDKLNKAN